MKGRVERFRFLQISEKVQKPLITWMTNAFTNKEKSVESFSEICVIIGGKIFCKCALLFSLTDHSI
jgi:hypothetical protein